MTHKGFYNGPDEKGDRPVTIDGVTYYPMPETHMHNGCTGCVGDNEVCDWLPNGCSKHNYIWRTDFEAVVHWAARAEKEKQHGGT